MDDRIQILRRLKGRFIAKLGYYWFGFVFGYQLGEHLWTLTENFIETNFSAA